MQKRHAPAAGGGRGERARRPGAAGVLEADLDRRALRVAVVQLSAAQHGHTAARERHVGERLTGRGDQFDGTLQQHQPLLRGQPGRRSAEPGQLSRAEVQLGPSAALPGPAEGAHQLEFTGRAQFQQTFPDAFGGVLQSQRHAGGGEHAGHGKVDRAPHGTAHGVAHRRGHARQLLEVVQEVFVTDDHERRPGAQHHADAAGPHESLIDVGARHQGGGVHQLQPRRVAPPNEDVRL
ncbi:hypothetical protein ACH4F6_15820 [Streptomyces sp. NPDC017936]|uniref:hypothetical protein n=1 Tax=Streptomyces sp. NPDC017936 TaxID=3365016 RepID=UPI003793384C